MQNLKTYIVLVWLLLTGVNTINAQQLHKFSNKELIELQLIPINHTNKFEQLQVQDFQGRTKPMHTLALDLVRKIYGKNNFKYVSNTGNKQKLNATQVFLGMQYRPDTWQLIPCIKVEKTTRDTIAKIIPISKDNFAKPAQFFDFQGNYKLKQIVADAYAKTEGKRNTLDKNIIKLDERLNIIWSIFNGQFLRVFPNTLDPNLKWFAPKDNTTFLEEDQLIYNKLIPTYLAQLTSAKQNNNWTEADKTIDIIKQFQKKNAGPTLITTSKVNWEISYNKQLIFLKSMIGYSMVGILLLIIGFSEIFFEKKWVSITGKIGMLLLIAIFFYHGFGIVLRWYLSGHAPWSNGYEATIFISWVSVFSGILFSKKTKMPAAATALIAVCLMGIAHGNLMNPEITNLVPVLKSYWLMIHVAIITGSYGFLTMGSLLALIVLVCMIFLTDDKKEIILPKINELTKINERTTNIGLFMLTIGTFLGGVWANESWGRYWGWDPKETWALISIIIYAFVLHIRIIFKKNHLYIYNLFSLFALSPLVMTFFGVNYYLSGLHSYAAGDSFPIPKWIYVVIPLLIVIALIAKIKWNTIKRNLTY